MSIRNKMSYPKYKHEYVGDFETDSPNPAYPKEVRDYMIKKKRPHKTIDPILVCTFEDGYRDTNQITRVIIDKNKQMVWERIQSRDALGIENWTSTNIRALPRNLNLKDWTKLKELCDKMIPICQEEHIIEGISADCGPPRAEDEDDKYESGAAKLLMDLDTKI